MRWIWAWQKSRQDLGTATIELICISQKYIKLQKLQTHPQKKKVGQGIYMEEFQKNTFKGKNGGDMFSLKKVFDQHFFCFKVHIWDETAKSQNLGDFGWLTAGGSDLQIFHHPICL